MVSIISTVDTGHEDMIHDAQMDYYGTKLATCSSDRAVKIFNIRNGTQVLESELQGHEGPVWQVTWAHPMFGTILASCSYDKKVFIWKENGGQWSRIYEHSNHDSSVNSVAWAPAEFGLVLACASSDSSVSILSYSSTGTWESKKIDAHNIGCNAVSWAPSSTPNSALQGSTKAVGGKRLVTGGCDNLVKIWREEKEEWVKEASLEAHSDWVRDVAWAPSVGLPRSMIASCSQDRHVIVWTNDGTDQTWTPTVVSTFDDVVWHVSWSTTGNILAVSGGDNKVSLWKESLEGQWVRLSDVNKGQGQIRAD